MQIDFNVMARAAKLIALFAFLLPWAVVSCSGTEIAAGTGWQWMTGHLQPSGALLQLQSQGGGQLNSDHQDPGYILIAAFAAIALGLFVSLVTRQKIAASVMLATALAGIALSYYNFEHLRTQMNAEALRQHGHENSVGGVSVEPDTQRDMQMAMASVIRVEKKEGYWVTTIALALAALFSGLSLGGLRLAPAILQKETPPPAPTG